MRFFRFIWLLLGLGLCQATQVRAQSRIERFEFSELHMGMRVDLTLYAPDSSAAHDAARAAFGEIARLEDVLSDYRPESEVSRLTDCPLEKPCLLSDELFAVLDTAIFVARITDGAFDPTVGSLVKLWREARRAGLVPDSQAVSNAMDCVGWDRVILERAAKTVAFRCPETTFDFGGIAKGYILDRAADAMAAQGVTRVLVEAGGDIVARDPPPSAGGWTVDFPFEHEMLRSFGGLVSNMAVSTSGDTEQFTVIDGTRYSHIVDPRTGNTSTGRQTVVVISASGMIADALATATSVMNENTSLELHEFFPNATIVVGQTEREYLY